MFMKPNKMLRSFMYGVVFLGVGGESYIALCTRSARCFLHSCELHLILVFRAFRHLYPYSSIFLLRDVFGINLKNSFFQKDKLSGGCIFR